MQKNSFWGAFEGCFGPMGKTNHENVGKQMENLRGRLGFFANLRQNEIQEDCTYFYYF